MEGAIGDGEWRMAEADQRLHPRTDRAREIFTMGFEYFGQDEEGIVDRKSVV